ncbi:hypothetical protein QBC33DRAFT_614214 [Phialemonium atrogriseum]|uniref:Ankyrin repeat protein n=1 Tax=Phialemonium atrogriseum TaxID=1093897 RepID=A0AAJ0BQI9_9PEZI|nr:uncharacterized protein QBC33DRAFT_614214 [Phialemonium atrogriseum]KAK1762620.1 hypothetical protein QBC33DRAFT_614214 [Phialemonium atrogriseum]
MFVAPRPDGGVPADFDPRTPPVEVLPSLKEIQEELDQDDEFSLEEYFDRLVDHLRRDAIRHSFDKAKSKIEDLLRVDLIGGAIKSLMLNRLFPRLSDQDAARMKTLCLLAYHINDPAELATVAYARRHVSVLQHLITHPGPRKSTFDLMWTGILAKRREPNQAFQHSSDGPDNRLLEWKMWTALLKSGWVHHPMAGNPGGIYWGLHWLVDYFQPDPEARASPFLEYFLKALSENGIILGVSTISRFLSIKEGQNFEMVLSHFPISAATGGDLKKGDSAELLLPITQWGRDNQDRLQVARLLLEQGVDPDGKVDGFEYGLPVKLMDPQLHKAAELGDMPMVELLLGFGARNDVLGGRDDTAVQRARASGYEKVAARIERQ